MGPARGADVELQPIPASAWHHLGVVNASSSVLVERTEAKTKIYGVRVYPILHSPRCVDLLSGLALSEAAGRYVFGDPEVKALASELPQDDLKLELMLRRRSWSQHGPVPWPLGPGYMSAEDDLADELPVSDVDRYRPFRSALYDRVAALLAPLQDGRLLARAVPARSNCDPQIPRSVWSHREFHVDLDLGDVLKYNARSTSEYDSMVTNWAGVMLAQPVDRNTETIHQAKAKRRSPRRDAVLAALREAGVDLASDRRSNKVIAADVASRLSVRTESQMAALTKMIGRLAKDARRTAVLP